MGKEQLILDVARLLFQVRRVNSTDSGVRCVLPFRFLDEQTTYFKDGKNKIGKLINR